MFTKLKYAHHKRKKRKSVESYHKAHRYTKLYEDTVGGFTFYGRIGDFHISTAEISIVTNHLGDYSVKQIFTSPFVLKVLRDFRDTGIITPYKCNHSLPVELVDLPERYGQLISAQTESSMFEVYYFAEGIKEEHFNIEAVTFTRVVARNNKIKTIEQFSLPTQILTKWDK